MVRNGRKWPERRKMDGDGRSDQKKLSLVLLWFISSVDCVKGKKAKEGDKENVKNYQNLHDY
jgi:hypothetical protein